MSSLERAKERLIWKQREAMARREEEERQEKDRKDRIESQKKQMRLKKRGILAVEAREQSVEAAEADRMMEKMNQVLGEQ